jgi:hypothetical protein
MHAKINDDCDDDNDDDDDDDDDNNDNNNNNVKLEYFVARVRKALPGVAILLSLLFICVEK